MVVCFQYGNVAHAVYKRMQQRLRQCGLEFAEDKTGLIEFGKFATENRKKRRVGKPETFDFLGFSHYCSKSNKTGKFRVKRKASKKKFRQKIQEFKVWIKKSRNKPLKEIMDIVNRKLIRHYNYYAITDNINGLNRYLYEITKLLFKWLNRKSQGKSYDWTGFGQMLEIYQLPKPKIKVNIYAI